MAAWGSFEERAFDSMAHSNATLQGVLPGEFADLAAVLSTRLTTFGMSQKEQIMFDNLLIDFIRQLGAATKESDSRGDFEDIPPVMARVPAVATEIAIV